MKFGTIRNAIMDIQIVKHSISLTELQRIADETFGDLLKAVVDIKQEIIAVGAELHADAEVLLTEKEGSKREDTWGINIYPKKPKEEWIEFDSMINLKPLYGNRSRNVESHEIQNKIKSIVEKLIAT